MATNSAAYEPFAWWLIREQIGLCLRERYRVPKDLPPRLLKLVRKFQAVEGNQELSPGLYMLFSKLDALEGNELLRACRKRDVLTLSHAAVSMSGVGNLKCYAPSGIQKAC
jgi:hypothetical protein